MNHLFLVILLSFGPLINLTSQDSIPLKTQILIEEYLNTLPTKTEIAIGIISNGNKYTFGYTKGKDGIRSLKNDFRIFEIGSISKTFTAALFQDQVIRGNLSPYESIYPHLKNNKQYDKEKITNLTFMHLLTHTSGIAPTPVTFIKPLLKAMIISPKNPNQYIKLKHFEKYLKKFDFDYKAGEKWEYNNTAFGLLGHIIANKENSSWDTLIHHRIFDDLKMNNTYSTGTYVQKEQKVNAYTKNGRPAAYWDMDFINPAGSIKSCSNDMLLWLDAHLKAKEGSLFHNMNQHYEVKTIWPDSFSGNSWIHKFSNHHHIIWHGGATGGYRAFSAFNIDENDAIVILINMNSNHDKMKNSSNKSLIRIYGFKILESLYSEFE